ncbi:AAA family ATPase [Pseudooceanicola sp. CBS1P-1]|uniref:AAA family ATPase n=1 Tax=Pseudooceanicola albus TaxID=2692189 RepID=A0A6L7G8F0_9RHOB|nr:MULTISPECIES: AAA family ATPase [Pseudooceanicola]MBT9384340.1 AAA family ATPase [Pseudooceanicola endophyticus]MXN19922.1 AAA family ATPase [Pseudooceanicola albus]
MTPPVITISGPPGSGKTTLARGLARHLGLGVVHYDDHEVFTRQPPAAIAAWLARGAPYAEMEAPGLAGAIAAECARGRGLVLDTPLGPLDPALRGRAVRAAWIDLPADLALARKLRQLNDSVQPGQATAFRGWLGGYLAAYEEIVRPACGVQAARLAPLCPIRIDGTASASACLDSLIRACSDMQG